MQLIRLLPLCLLTLPFIAARVDASEIDNRAKITATVDKPKARRGEMVVWKMTVEPKPGYHTYPSEQPPDAEDKDAVTTLRRPRFGPFVFVGQPTSPRGHLGLSQGKKVELIDTAADWEWRFIVHPDAKPGKYTLHVPGNLTVCDEKNCVPGDPPAIQEFEIIDGKAEDVPAEYREIVTKFPLEKAQPKPVDPPAGVNGADALRGTAAPMTLPAEGKNIDIARPAQTLEEAEANLKAVSEQLEKFTPPADSGKEGLWAFLASAAFWGFVALLTPCVFPMIPI